MSATEFWLCAWVALTTISNVVYWRMLLRRIEHLEATHNCYVCAERQASRHLEATQQPSEGKDR